MLNWWVHLSWSQAVSVAILILALVYASIFWLWFVLTRPKWPKTPGHNSFFSSSKRDYP